MDWLSKIDPNVVVPAIAALLAWGYHKLRGDTKDHFDDVLRGIGKQVITSLLASGLASTELDKLKELAQKKLWEIAVASGVPRNALTERIATAVIEHTIGDALEEIRNREAAAKLPGQLDELAKQISDIPAMIDKAHADGLARGKAFFDEMVEKLPPST